MKQIYLEYTFEVIPPQPGTDILIAQLGEAGFESFVENEKGVTAYILKEELDAQFPNNISILSHSDFEISFTVKEIPSQNWNAVWEENFDPIVVSNTCTVRAPFHDRPETEYDIIIEPKMSFGTGHHETTHMMIQHILHTDMRDKTVLDMGSGTGVLAILAEKKGALAVDAIDIDNWCYVNALENVERNGCHAISVYEGDATLLGEKMYDVVIANINRNILLNDIPHYIGSLRKGGVLLLSGFYKDDIPIIHEACVKHSLKLAEKLEKNFWVALKYVN